MKVFPRLSDPMSGPAPILTKEEFEKTLQKGIEVALGKQADNLITILNTPMIADKSWYKYFGRECTIDGERGRLGMTRVYAVNAGADGNFENGRKLRICLFYPNRVLEGLTV